MEKVSGPVVFPEAWVPRVELERAEKDLVAFTARTRRVLANAREAAIDRHYRTDSCTTCTSVAPSWRCPVYAGIRLMYSNAMRDLFNVVVP